MHEQMSAEVRAALEQCRGMIAKGSKSFSLAAHLFGPETRHAAFFLYGWCRYCDDQIDQADPAGSVCDVERRLNELKESTRSAFAQEPQKDPVFIAFQYVTQRYAVPQHYPLELLEGMAMDVRKQRYETLSDLQFYCYRVAGTVGLMMAHIMGIRDEKALRHSADLGTAMQLTNIARDVIEDAQMGRIYLPLEWLGQAGIAEQEIQMAKNRDKLAVLIRRLLGVAETFYRSGDQGFWYLSFRSACAVAAARFVYSEIGWLLLQKGARAWDERTYVSTGRKLRVVAQGVLRVASSIPSRFLKPWSAVPITTVWRHAQIH
jgi:15-cis-phytoene synthase